MLESVTGFHLHRGALAAMQRPEPLPLASVLASSQRVAIVEDVVDHTNLGRSSARRQPCRSMPCW